MTTTPRVRRIKVTGLFGIFDHEIPLNMDERITILHGPNGYGKTKILGMVDALLDGPFDGLASVPFESFAVEFEGGGILEVRHIPVSDDLYEEFMAIAGLVVTYRRSSGTEPEVMECANLVPTFPLGDIDDLRAKASRQVQEWIGEKCGEVGTLLVNTQRLLHEHRPSRYEQQILPAVLGHSQAIVQRIQEKLATYAAHAQELDSTFLDRLFQPQNALSVGEAEARLQRLEEKRARLIRLGVLEPEREAHRKLPPLDPSKLDVLTVYLDHTESKLEVLEDLTRRIDLLTAAINRRFAYKRMSISREDGLVFHSLVDGSVIPLESLSSGEQHELVLLSTLLFHVDPGVLVLIDEPEISLHLAWQNEFLDDLLQIGKLGGYDVLVATHSPAIINDRWDLTVELKGPELPAKAAE
ncbi:AAA family ATPase [Polyangium mundeleinium]|uniref:AAA family ATPase n=1 Tax=Polyangium mundeleinium TaxID=2995306 RepID=A0ABT5F3A3_9BACT|nr:AAA family ATPase [Polyangium mundeleinium]MDC0748104.1 AAA family ATPase [Polyangium mundeleinium]